MSWAEGAGVLAGSITSLGIDAAHIGHGNVVAVK
jgi:hypothetical protein